MQYKQHLKTLLILGFTVFFVKATYSQSRSSISFAYGVNKPYSGDYNFGSGFNFQGDIAFGDKWAVSSTVGYEHLLSKHRVIYDPSGFAIKRISNIDLIYTGPSLKYCFNRTLYAKLGAMAYAAGGNEDLSGLGIGGSAEVGGNLDLDAHNSLRLSLGTDVIDLQSAGNGITPVASLKLAYAFNFKGIK